VPLFRPGLHFLHKSFRHSCINIYSFI
jgi:hypothetical protein